MQNPPKQRAFTFSFPGNTASTSVYVGPFLSLLADFGTHRSVFVVDKNVADLYVGRLPIGRTYLLEVSEEKKDLKSIEALYLAFARSDVDRSSLVVAIGGGLTTDLVGFAASTYLRGLRTAFVPTTLLSQVDAALGGKNGVNFGHHKNQIGLVHQPAFVFCDTSFLRTQHDSEYRSGIAEIIKTACIVDPCLFQFLETSCTSILNRDAAALDFVVLCCVCQKYGIVTQDETENGLRRILNFGHTLAHSIELIEKMPHGHAVAIGIHFATYFSALKGHCSPDLVSVIRALLERYGLPTRARTAPDLLMNAMTFDKKRQQTSLEFVFIKEIGQAFTVKTSLQDIADGLKGWLA